MNTLRISRMRGLIPTRELIGAKWALRLRRPPVSWRRRVTRDYWISLLLRRAINIISMMEKHFRSNSLKRYATK